MFRLLVGDVSAITVSSDGGGESGSLVLGLADLAMSVVDLCKQREFRQFVIEVLRGVCFRE